MSHFGSIRNPVRFSNSEAMRFNFIPNLPRFFIARFVAHPGKGVIPKHQGNFAGTGAFNHE